MSAASAAVRKDLAPTGTLRVGINFANKLLTARDPGGKPVGVALDLAHELGERLGVPVQIVEYPSPGGLADAAVKDEWDVGFLGAEPQRAQVIDFTPPYVEIEATYLVPGASRLKTIADVDTEGVRIIVPAKAAYELWLSRHLKNAKLSLADGADNAFQQFVAQRFDALAGLKVRLLKDQATLPGSRLIPGRFTAVQQAAGTPKGRAAGAQYLTAFIEDAKQSGLVAKLIEKHKVGHGLTVSAPA